MSSCPVCFGTRRVLIRGGEVRGQTLVLNSITLRDCFACEGPPAPIALSVTIFGTTLQVATSCWTQTVPAF